MGIGIGGGAVPSVGVGGGEGERIASRGVQVQIMNNFYWRVAVRAGNSK